VGPVGPGVAIIGMMGTGDTSASKLTGPKTIMQESKGQNLHYILCILSKITVMRGHSHGLSYFLLIEIDFSFIQPCDIN
jgi:hypothetical protein